MQHRRQHQHQLHALQRCSVPILRVDDVRHRVGQRPVVANAAGEDVGHVAADALVHDARREHALLDGLTQPTRAVDRIDGAHVVAMAAFDRLPGFQVDTE